MHPIKLLKRIGVVRGDMVASVWLTGRGGERLWRDLGGGEENLSISQNMSSRGGELLMVVGWKCIRILKLYVSSEIWFRVRYR